MSTSGQTVESQLEQLGKAVCARIYSEKISGDRSDRPELQRLLKALEPRSVVVVTRLDRLARSTIDLLTTIKHIADNGCLFKSLAEPWADTTTPGGRLMLTVLGGLAEFEGELIKIRTSDGRERALDLENQVVLIVFLVASLQRSGHASAGLNEFENPAHIRSARWQIRYFVPVS